MKIAWRLRPEAKVSMRAARYEPSFLTTRRASDGTLRWMVCHWARASFLGRMTRSNPVGIEFRWVRNDSRISRFQRFRWTALPVFLGIVMPMRVEAESSRRTANRTRTPSATHSPRFSTRVMSAARTSRSVFGKQLESGDAKRFVPGERGSSEHYGRKPGRRERTYHGCENHCWGLRHDGLSKRSLLRR